MNTLYSKILIMFGTIILGAILKKFGILDKKDASVISKIILNITCPAMIVVYLNGLTVGSDIFLALVAGILVNAIFFSSGFITSRKDTPDNQVIKIFCTSSLNVGGLGLPFVSALAPANAVAAVVAFNYVGTPIFTLGIEPSFAATLYEGKGNLTIKGVIKKLVRSICGMTCFIMIGLCLLHISFPESIMGFFESLYKANNTLAMLVIGILININIPKEELKKDLGIIFIRFITAILISLLIYFCLPVSLEIKKALSLIAFVPPSSASPAIALQSGYKGSTIANIISLETLIFIPLMYIVMIILY